MGEDFEERFEYKSPTDQSVEKIKEVREGCKQLSLVLQKNADPYSREGRLAMEKLEEVSMWANKSIVFNQVTTNDLEGDK